MSERVWITTETTTEAEAYHRHPKRCLAAQKTELTEVSTKTCRENDAKLCGYCEHLDSDQIPTHGLAKKLLDMDVDDVLGGGNA